MVTAADYRRRRVLFTLINLVSMGLLITAMAILLNTGGWHWTDMVMLGAFTLTLPWLTIGFWNAMIGFGLTVFTRDPVAHVSPSLLVDDATRVKSRTAIVMTVRNEDAQRALDRFRAVQQSVARTQFANLFDFHLLSDTDQPEIAAEEELLVEQWRATTGQDVAIHYRRRDNNTGFKAGNVMAFAQDWRGKYDFFIPLDADSLMSGDAIIRLVRKIEANPQIGILQGLVVGMPSDSAFARLFQFGMRHGMRAYTMGSAWWHGDCGPFWGHNAVVRMSSFVDHGEMPILPGKAPLGGHILSHDQVEAALIRRGGFEVRVWPIEDASFEENPPSLPDFIKRDIRWCQGNMQYWRLLGLPGLKPTSRVQLALAIQMFLGAPAWMLFVLTGAYQVAFVPGFGIYPVNLGIGLFFTILFTNMAPQIMGTASVLCSRVRREQYGGGWRVALGTFAVFIVMTLLAPIIALTQTVFQAGLPFGRMIKWEAQRRDGRQVSWREATINYWPHMLFGLAIGAVIAFNNPGILPWAAPMLLGFSLVIPMTVITAAPALGAWCVKHGAFDIPEDRDMPHILRTVRCRGRSTPALVQDSDIGGMVEPGLKPKTEAA